MDRRLDADVLRVAGVLRTLGATDDAALWERIVGEHLHFPVQPEGALDWHCTYCAGVVPDPHNPAACPAGGREVGGWFQP